MVSPAIVRYPGDDDATAARGLFPFGLEDRYRRGNGSRHEIAIYALSNMAGYRPERSLENACGDAVDLSAVPAVEATGVVPTFADHD